MDGAGGEDARGYIQGDHGVALTLGDGILRREADKKRPVSKKSWNGGGLSSSESVRPMTVRVSN